MTRIVMFIIAALMIFGVVKLGSYKELPTQNERFSYEAQKEKYHKKLETLAELERKRLEALMPKVEEEVVEEGPVVVLDTPQLERAHKLYAKCIACHGKRGEGKKSQKAPRLGGQMAWYIESALVAMKTGERENKVMNPYLKNLSEEDFKDLGVYLSKMPWE